MNLKLKIGFLFIIMYVSINHLYYPDLIFQLTNSGHWELIFCQLFIQLTLIWIYLKGLSYFPKHDVIDIFLNMGNVVAFLLLIPFVVFLTALVGLNTRLHTEIINSIFLSRTPYWSIVVLLFIITTYIALQGLGTILRSSFFIFFMIIPILLFLIFTSIINVDWYNALPAWNPSMDFVLNKKIFYLMGYSAFLPLGFMAYKTKITFRPIFLAWLCLVFFSLTSVYVPLLIFGQETAGTLKFSMVKAISTVNIEWFFLNKQSMFLGLSLIGFTVVLDAVFLWIIGRIMCKLTKWRKTNASSWIIIFSFGSLFGALLIPNQDWSERFFLWSLTAQVYFTSVIPLTIYIYGMVMNRGKTL